MLDTMNGLIRRYVIAGRDPRDPVATKNGVKDRARLAILVPPVATYVLLYNLGVPSYWMAGAGAGVFYIALRAVTRTINEVADEFRDREQAIREVAHAD